MTEGAQLGLFDPRCGHEHDGLRCTLEPGHGGVHYAQGWHWMPEGGVPVYVEHRRKRAREKA
jgi:hypothetical protein